MPHWAPKNTHMSPRKTLICLLNRVRDSQRGCTLVSVLLHAGSTAPQATTALAPTALLDPLPSNFVLWTIQSFSAPIRIPSQPSCPQLPRKLHVLTSPVVLAFISCMLYIDRSVFNWRCPISPDTGRSQEGMRCSRHLVAAGHQQRVQRAATGTWSCRAAW